MNQFLKMLSASAESKIKNWNLVESCKNLTIHMHLFEDNAFQTESRKTTDERAESLETIMNSSGPTVPAYE